MISIVIPTFNRALIIPRALNSIISQTFQDWECIVVDDHSSDNTRDVIDEYIKNDARFHYLDNVRKKGAPGARNTGLLAAKGEFVVFFDSDNAMHPDFLRKIHATIEKEVVDVCGSFSRVIDKDTDQMIGMFEWKGYGRIHSNLLTGKSYFDNSSTLIRKQKLLDIGLLDEDCPSYQEWDTHIRLSKICTYTMVEEALVDYYRGGEDTISASVEKEIKGLLYVLEKYRVEWVLCYPLSYLKKVCNVFRDLQSIRDKERYKELRLLYKNNVVSVFRCVAYMVCTI